MKTVYESKLKGWFEDVDEGSRSLEYGPFEFYIDKAEYGVIQYEVYVSSKYFETDDTPRLTYMVDEFGGHESLEKAKRAVETFLSNELKIDFDFLDTNHI